MQQIIGNADGPGGFTLSGGQFFGIKIIDQIMEHCVPVDLCAQMHENGAKTDRCPVHQDEFTRRFDPSNAFQLGMHLPRKIAASLAIAQLLDWPDPILEQRSIDETSPNV